MSIEDKFITAYEKTMFETNNDQLSAAIILYEEFPLDTLRQVFDESLIEKAGTLLKKQQQILDSLLDKFMADELNVIRELQTEGWSDQEIFEMMFNMHLELVNRFSDKGADQIRGQLPLRNRS